MIWWDCFVYNIQGKHLAQVYYFKPCEVSVTNINTMWTAYYLFPDLWLSRVCIIVAIIVQNQVPMSNWLKYSLEIIEKSNLTGMHLHSFSRWSSLSWNILTCCFWYAVFGLIFDSNSSDPKTQRIEQLSTVELVRMSDHNKLCHMIMSQILEGYGQFICQIGSISVDNVKRWIQHCCKNKDKTEVLITQPQPIPTLFISQFSTESTD